METLKADCRFFVYANETTKRLIINRAEGYKRDGKWTLTYWITVKMSDKSKKVAQKLAYIRKKLYLCVVNAK